MGRQGPVTGAETGFLHFYDQFLDFYKMGIEVKVATFSRSGVGIRLGGKSTEPASPPPG